MLAKEHEIDPLREKRISGIPEVSMARTPRRGIYLFIAAFTAAVAIPFVLALQFHAPWWIIVAVVCFFVLSLMSVRVVQQWERAVVLRLGRFNRVTGPGFFFIIPFIESAALHVDQRIMATPFSAEEALTADLVPTDIDAVLFWVVTNPEKAWCEVGDYKSMVLWSAQTALRDAVGRTNLSDISLQRFALDQELKTSLNEKTKDWGISILSVEIRNILIPTDLQELMSREAQAYQESQGRLILAEMECQIAELLSDAAKTYNEDETAFQIRMAALLNESIKESGGTVVLIPNALSEGFKIVSHDTAH